MFQWVNRRTHVGLPLYRVKHRKDGENTYKTMKHNKRMGRKHQRCVKLLIEAMKHRSCGPVKLGTYGFEQIDMGIYWCIQFFFSQLWEHIAHSNGGNHGDVVRFFLQSAVGRNQSSTCQAANAIPKQGEFPCNPAVVMKNLDNCIGSVSSNICRPVTQYRKLV